MCKVGNPGPIISFVFRTQNVKLKKMTSAICISCAQEFFCALIVVEDYVYGFPTIRFLFFGFLIVTVVFLILFRCSSFFLIVMECWR